MRGKKIDTEFVANFVSKCVTQNIINKIDICEMAKKEISEIDLKIKEAENLKRLRSKLLDVIISFDEPKKDHSKDKLLLSFYQVNNKALAKDILSLIINDKNTIKLISSKLKNNFMSTDINFTIKQLLELKVLEQEDLVLNKGNLFSEFSSFIKEYNGKRHIQI